MESIATVSHDDRITGYAPKLLVHQQGLLHRAFSVVIFNNAGEILMQKRAITKYHSGGLWTNTCCSHLIDGKEMGTYMHERLQHEMGIDCDLKFAFTFHYTAKFDNGLTENEIDHVYIGIWDGTPLPNPTEADDYRWATMDDIKSEIERNPDSFTYWFKEIIFRLSTFSSAKAKSLNF